MWLTSSTIGRKFVMALTGVCLVLFVTFHVLMNSVAIVWPTAYNEICRFLGANWYALVASVGLAALFIIHIIYAVWLTVINRKARGGDSYAVTSRPPQVEWSSKNMLVLGIVIAAFLGVHLAQFWYRMQFQEIVYGHDAAKWTQVNGVVAQPEFGTLFLQAAFSHIWTLVVYCIGFIALWFHMSHGFWSMFHSVGWDNNKWIQRLKDISYAWTSVVVALFVIQAIVFTVKAHSENNYLNDEALQQQYEEFWDEQSEKLIADFTYSHNQVQTSPNKIEALTNFYETKVPAYRQQCEFILNGVAKQCPDAESVNVIEVQDLYKMLGGTNAFGNCKKGHKGHADCKSHGDCKGHGDCKSHKDCKDGEKACQGQQGCEGQRDCQGEVGCKDHQHCKDQKNCEHQDCPYAQSH